MRFVPRWPISTGPWSWCRRTTARQSPKAGPSTGTSSDDAYPVLAILPPLHPASLGRSRLLCRPRAAVPLRRRRDGQRHRLGRSRRGDGPRRDARLLRRGRPVARPHRGRDRPLEGQASRVSPFGFNLIHSPNEPAHRGGDRRPVPAPRRPAGRGVGVPRPDAARRALPADRHPPRTPTAGSSRRTGSSPRCRGSRWRPSSSPPPPEQFVRELVAQGDLTAEQAELAQARPGGPGRDRRGRLRRAHRQPARPSRCCRRMLALRDRLQAQYGYADAAAGRAGGRHRDAGVGGGGVRDGGRLRRDRLGQPGVRRVGQLRRRPADARRGRAGRRGHGPGRRHVRDGRQGAGAQARHDVRHAGRQAVRALPRLPVARRDPRRPSAASWRRTCSAARSTRSGGRRGRSSCSRDPAQVPKAERDPKHKMALVFRWYLGQSSRWANAGEPDRKVDYQVWCGPAMGAFNEWAKGSFLEEPENRRVVTVALNLLYGAAVTLRRGQLRVAGRGPGRAVPARPAGARRVGTPAGVNVARLTTPAGCRTAAIASCSRRRSLRDGRGLMAPRASHWPSSASAACSRRRTAPARSGPTSSTASRHRPGPADALAARRLLRRRPEAARPHLRGPRRLPRPGRLQPARVRHRPERPRGDRHVAAARPGRRPAGAERRRLHAGPAKFDRNRVSVILGVTGTLELVIPLGARLGHPIWRKALEDAGVDEETADEVVQRDRRRLRRLAGELVPRPARQRRRRPDRQPARPGRHQLRRRRRLRQLAERDPPGRPGAGRRPVRRGRHRRRRHVQRHLHVHVLQQDAGPVADRRRQAVRRRRRRHHPRRGAGHRRAEAAGRRRARRRPHLRGHQGDRLVERRQGQRDLRPVRRRPGAGACRTRTSWPACRRRRSSWSRPTAPARRSATRPRRRR